MTRYTDAAGSMESAPAFITQDGGGDDVFCHHTAIKADGSRTLAEGQKVEFDVNRGPKGLQAANVRPL